MMQPPFLDADQILAATFICHVEIRESLGSTNDRAAELARDPSIELPALVVARHQTAGRGRGQNRWWSADGALTFSVLLDPATFGITSNNWPQFSLAAAVAVCDALSYELNPKSEIRNPKSPRLAIKWPNDVMLGGRKVCGILIESPGGLAPAKDRLIIGIGINVNNSWRDAPCEIAASGTALCDIIGRQHDLQSILSKVLIALATRIGELRSSAATLARTWQQLDWLRGQNVAIDRNEQRFEGRCLSIDVDGAIVVATIDGARRFHSGTVQLT